MRSLQAARRPEPPAPVVVQVDPDDGRLGVFRDAPVMLRLSQPLHADCLSGATFSVRDPDGPVPGALRVVGDGDVLIWRASRPLRADALHFVVVSGLLDRRGRAVPRHLSRFVPCAFESRDWPCAP